MIDFDKFKAEMGVIDLPEPPTILATQDSPNTPNFNDNEDEPESRSTPVFSLPEIVDSFGFCSVPLPEPPALIKGLIHQGTKVIVGGGSKSFKTWLQLDAAISVAYGVPWMEFETVAGRVLFVNFEIQPAFFQQRVNKICESRGISQEANRLDLWNLRGFSAPYAQIIPLIIARIKDAKYSLVVLDPIYKLYGSANENDASEVAQLLNALEKVCVDTGAAVMFGAHYSKGNQSGKESIDRISGSGVFARDPDSIIPFTRHEEEGSFVVEPTLRNLPPVEPFVVSWNFPLMERDQSLDPAKLKSAVGRPKEFTAGDLFDLLPEGGLSLQKWMENAAKSLKMSRATFYRLKTDLKSQNRIFFSRLEEYWKPLANKGTYQP